MQEEGVSPRTKLLCKALETLLWSFDPSQNGIDKSSSTHKSFVYCTLVYWYIIIIIIIIIINFISVT